MIHILGGKSVSEILVIRTKDNGEVRAKLGAGEIFIDFGDMSLHRRNFLRPSCRYLPHAKIRTPVK
jgi:hypothetical protein